MMGWVVLGILLLIVIIFIFKYQNYQASFANFTIGAIIIFLIVSVGYVYIVSNVDLTSFDGIVDFGRAYSLWLGGIFKNIGRTIGYAVNKAWGVNATNLSGQ